MIDESNVIHHMMKYFTVIKRKTLYDWLFKTMLNEKIISFFCIIPRNGSVSFKISKDSTMANKAVRLYYYCFSGHIYHWVHSSHTGLLAALGNTPTWELLNWLFSVWNSLPPYFPHLLQILVKFLLINETCLNYSN